MDIETITIGNEVLSGRTLDTNAAFLARALEAVSVRVVWHTTVGDSGERIGEALTRALHRADGVVMTGGLGPTPDDITRKAVATVLGRPLQLDETVLASIRDRARRLGRKLPPSFESQALIPRGAQIWKNSLGSAPGLLILHSERPIVMLPGVPHEMEALVHEFLVPYLADRTGLSIETFTLRTAGVFETLLHEAIGQLPQNWPGASLAYLPSFFGVDLRVTVSGEDRDRVNDATGRAYQELKKKVAPVIYAEGSSTMEEVVGEALVEQGFRIAVAESCTGGLLAKRLTDVPGSSRYFDRGFVTYSNVAKVELLGVRTTDLEEHGAVSAPVAEQMATGAARRAGADVGVAITGIAGPDGGTPEKPVGTVFIAISSPQGVVSRKYNFVGTRSVIRERSAQSALDLVRRQVRGLPLEAKLGGRVREPDPWRRSIEDMPRDLMRLFFAVFPPPAVQRAAFAMEEALRRPGDPVSWVKVDNLHYTLRFMGDLGADGARRCGEAADEAAAAIPAFDAALGALGAFPKPANARVLWVGLARGGESLTALAKGLETGLRKRGFDRADRPFSAHLTIGRVRNAGEDWTARLAAEPAADPATAPFRVDRLLLMESRLSPKGSTYTVKHEARLPG